MLKSCLKGIDINMLKEVEANIEKIKQAIDRKQ